MMPRFEEGSDYEIIYMIPGAHRKPRVARLGYMGERDGGGLQFDARGPDRSTSGRYGGTQELRREHILAATAVVRDKAKRYMNRMYNGAMGPRPGRGSGEGRPGG